MIEKIMDILKNYDEEVGTSILSEYQRQNRNIELIASENFVSEEVMLASANVLTNKYAEGFPAKRYYGGCDCVDVTENIAIDRLKKIFGAEHANVQPHSGAQANMAVYYALCESGDTVLGMSLAHGGHLTHGSPVNQSGKQYNIVSYKVDEISHRINYEEVRELAIKHKPKMIIAGASAYSREIDFEKFSKIAKEVGAYLFVDMAHIAGLVAAKLHQNPVEFADVVTSTTHKTLRGPRGGIILCKKELANKIDKAIFPGTQGGPLMHIIAAKAIAFGEVMKPEFNEYQKNILKNAKHLEKALIKKGFTLISGGTDNHLILIDLTNMNITGKELEKRLDEVYITTNKNSIPNDTQTPFITSGIRVGTPAVTSRGFGYEEMEKIAEFIYLATTDFENSAQKIREDVTKICDNFPLYK